MEEYRVGYATIDILAKETKDYIMAHTVDHKYVGKLDYLVKAQEMNTYLRRTQK